MMMMLLLQAYAKTSGHASSSLVQLLLQHGATAGNPNAAVDESCAAMAGLTPLHLLACWSPVSTTNSSSSSSSSSSSATTHASKHGSSSRRTAIWEDNLPAAMGAGVCEHTAAAELLLEQPLGVPAVDAPGVDVQFVLGSPLLLAAATGAHDFAVWLISKGADVNLPRKVDAARPLDLAVAGGYTRVACMLLEHGAEVSML
jgi:ankyrin repeat protein